MCGAIDVLALIARCLSSAYSPCKDCILCYKNRLRDIEDLPKNINVLNTCLASIESKKEEIDEKLSDSVQVVPNKNYEQLEKNISYIRNKRTQHIEKYKRITGNQLNSTAEQADTPSESSLIEEVNNRESSVTEEVNNWESSVTEEIKKRKWKRLSRKFVKLAKLSRVIAKLNKYGSDMRDTMDKETYTRRKRKPDAYCQEKLNVDKYHPAVFDNHVDEVVKYLHEGKNVGIYGRPGVGKTWVMELLFNRLTEDKSSLLIWTKYPQEEDADTIKSLQEEIMEQLGIKHEATGNTDKNAKTISGFLDGKKCILLIDQVWKEIKLEELLGLKQKNEHNVVIAGTDEKVSSSETDVTVKIQKLEKVDAMKLFRDVCGENLDNRKTEIADRIVDCCDGIQWMIRRVAKHLEGQENEDSWNNVKETLQSDSPGPNAVCGLEKTYELIYKGLDTDTKKQCLLYGALFPQRYPIPRDYLIECWTAEGFINIGNPSDKVTKSRYKGSGILDDLTQKSLLYSCDEKKRIMMPTDFRRMALTPGYFEEKLGVYWVQRCEEEPPNAETWTKVIRMSWIRCTTELPESPECLDIQTLLLQRKPNLQRFEDLFFHHMKSLKVLNLNHTEIRSLPTSISKLENLVSLYLKDCKRLESLPPQAASLVKLEFLDIQRTSIPSLPREVQFMVELRCLRASLPETICNHNPEGLEYLIPEGIIRHLKKLEELSIFGYKRRIAEADGGRAVEEMISLEYLTTLYFNFPNVISVDKFVGSSMYLNKRQSDSTVNRLRSFRIFIGSHETGHPYGEKLSGALPEKRLRFSTNEEFSPACKELLKEARDFEIIGHDRLRSLSEFEFESVKVCVVKFCNSLKNIVDGVAEKKKQDSVKDSLQRLYLYKLPLLQCICEGPVPSRSLNNLTALEIIGCSKLTKILDPASACALQNLTNLTVENCGVIQIIEVPEEGSNNSQQQDLSDILKRLFTMKLTKLPELHSICRNTSISWKSLNSMVIKGCPKLRDLSLSCTNAEDLLSIQCEESLWENFEFSPELKERLDKLWVKLPNQPELGETSTVESQILTGHHQATIPMVEEEKPLSDNLQFQ